MDENNGEVEGGSKGEVPEGNAHDGKPDEYGESVGQPKDGKVQNPGSHGQSKDSTVGKAENAEKAKGPPKRRKIFQKTNKTSGVVKLTGRFRSFGATVKKLWDVWGRFKTKNVQDPMDPYPSASEKTLGVPGFEEIACIEAEVPDIMMMDKDRVRTSCKECMKDPPTFPSKEQIKTKLIAADKYYGVNSAKMKREQPEAALEHEADYHDVDGTVVRPSWRFILERPLVEQYVLMTNYIRKVSVLSELEADKHSKKYIDEEDSSSDTEYKKFEQKFIKEKRELLKPMQKANTQEMAVQTSFEFDRPSRENLKESLSEISLYPESEESTNSPEASAVTIVTSRDYTSPVQSDFDGRTTDKSTSYRSGNWWESPAACQPSDSFQTSYDSINKNTSSGSDGQSVPIHSTWGKTALPRGAFSNESDSQITPRSLSVQPATHRKPKDSKKVSFSPVVTYYQGPNKNEAVYNLPDDEESAMETNQVERQQPETAENAPQDQITENPAEDMTTDEKRTRQEEIPNSIVAERHKPAKKKEMFGNVLQDKKRGQIVSVSLPADWSENRILHNKQKVNVVVSRPPAAKRSKKISFQEYEEIPDVDYSDSRVSTVQGRTDANIQTQTPVALKSAEKCKPIKQRESPPPQQPLDYRTLQNSRHSKTQPVDDNHPPTQIPNFSDPFPLCVPNTKIPNAEVNLSRWVMHEGTESIGMETNVQSPPSHLKSARPSSETPRAAEQKFDGRKTLLASTEKIMASNTAVQQINFPNTNAQTEEPLMENSPRYQPRMKETGDTHPRNVQCVDVLQSANPDHKPVNQCSRTAHSQQQTSTDTEGPSSSSNEHIKLKSSPACFFKVATPTDLSKISVDEFYPDVPEIDAELSQVSENRTSSAPRVEIVYASKEATSRCMQDPEFRRVTRKEGNTTVQRSIKKMEDEPIRMNASSKGRTITASAGVGIKTNEGVFNTPKDKGQIKPSKVEVSKSTKSSSQQSSITQCLMKGGATDKQPQRESEKERTIFIETQTTICETGLGSRVMKQATIRADEETRASETSLGEPVMKPATIRADEERPEVKPTNTNTSAPLVCDDLLNDQDMVSKRKVKTSPTVVTKQAKSNLPTSPDKGSHLTSSSKKYEQTPPHEKVVNDMTKAGEVRGGTEKRYPANDEDDDTLITIQRQMETPLTDPADQLPNGRGKLYMRTLSSLAEETSSAVESASSSAQEKLIDMPVMERSVEELKTIFEKKAEVASMSGASEMQVEESRSDPKKCTGLSNEIQENDEASGKAISVEIITSTNDANKTAIINHSQHKPCKKSNTKSKEDGQKSQGPQNLLTAAARCDDYDANGNEMAYSNSSAAEDGKSVRSTGNSHNANRKAKQPSALIQEESSVQQVSQIDVIRASEIYSNTSMYFSSSSSSEDRIAKLSKARTVFQPVTLDDDLVSSACSRDTERTANDNPEGRNERHPGSSKSVDSNEKHVPRQTNKDLEPQEEGLKLKTHHEGDNCSVGQDNQQIRADTRQNLLKEKGETEDTRTNVPELSSGSATNTNKEKLHKEKDVNQPTNPMAKTKSRTDDTSNPSETKHWLMDVIPILSQNTRFRGFRAHKPICVKEVTEAEAVKYRQEAVKPVFRFLKRQREMEQNKK